MDITNFEIKKLTPELVDDYLRFFDTTPHDDEISTHKCYCVCWSSADCEGDDDSSAQKRKKLAREYVNKNYIQGYLAYVDGKAIGWCNSNTKSECFNSRNGRRYFDTRDVTEMSDGIRIKSVFCFVIAPEMRRKGISGLLLERVCEDAKADGFDCVEAYPIKEFISTQYDCMGPAKLYEKQGFITYFDYGDRLVVRKALK